MKDLVIFSYAGILSADQEQPNLHLSLYLEKEPPFLPTSNYSIPPLVYTTHQALLLKSSFPQMRAKFKLAHRKQRNCISNMLSSISLVQSGRFVSLVVVCFLGCLGVFPFFFFFKRTFNLVSPPQALSLIFMQNQN